MRFFQKCVEIFLIFKQVLFYYILKVKEVIALKQCNSNILALQWTYLELDLSVSSGMYYISIHTYLAQRLTMITKVVPPERGYSIALQDS